ncbi:MAG: TonB-dependent receptor [Marinoscillum sp.]
MHAKLPKLIIRMSKIAIYAVIVCYSLTMAFGHDSMAQRKYLSQITLELDYKGQSLLDLIHEIEQSSEFRFAYSKKDLKNKSISITSGKWNMESLLREISVKAEVSLKRINETITIKEVKKDAELPEVTELVNVQAKISGTVTDENGESLPGATITVKGTTNGTITDIDGKYSLNVEEGDVLIFSFVGYQPQEVTIDGQTNINVALELDLQDLQEVVVIGYQTVRKKDLTGSTSIISPEASSKVSANSLAESIQGLTPGVTVRNGGAPGAGAQIEIRGAASFDDNGPLYVIDGMLADANVTINTNDIASIQILKDASAAAIYGSRAGNGVIIITTKSGDEGPMKINFSAKTGLQQLPGRWDVMNNEEFADLQTQQYENSGLTPPALVADDFDPSVNTDWQDEMIQLGTLSDYNVSMSGGSDAGSFMVSGSYFTNEGVIKGRSFDRYSLRINTRSRFGRVTVGENMVLTHSTTEDPGAGNPFYDMPQLLPVIPIQDEEYISESNPQGWGIGSVNAPSYAWNPVAILDLSQNNANYSKIVGNAFIQADFTDWLSYKFNYGLEASFDRSKNLRKEGVWSFNAAPYPGGISEYSSIFWSNLLEHTLNINKKIGKHDIKAVFGMSYQGFGRESSTAGRTELQEFNGRVLNTINGATGDPSASGGRSESAILGYLGRVNYIYDDKYLLTLTGRIDYSSKFAPEYRRGAFPSVAAGWRISEESFFNVPWVSNLKLTGSYGQLGFIPSSVGSWDWVGRLNSNPRAIFGPGQLPVVGAYQSRIVNRQLQWETRIIQNVGIDLGLLDDKVLFTAELYSKVSEDLIVSPSLPLYLGNLNGSPYVNAGSIKNSGIEISATYRKREGLFNWDLSANLTTIKNEVLAVGNRGPGINYIQTGLTRSQEGRPISEWFLLKTDGIFQNEQEVLDHANDEGIVIQPFAQPGDIRFVDINGDGQITADDRDYSGKSPWPTLQAGSQFNASYKSFSLNVQLIGVFGNSIYNGVKAILDGYQNTNFRSDIQPWTEENPNTNDPRIGVATNDVALTQNAGASTRWLESGSYVRVRNLELAYNFSDSMFGNAGISGARIYVSGQNLLTFTKYSGLDPDVTGNGILERGFDSGNWPASRVYSAGIQFSF